MAWFELDGKLVESYGSVPQVALHYPRISGKATEIEVGLVDVRAADNIRIAYDFDRDGWVIKQASTFGWDDDDEECDQDWQEVSFIPAWQRKNQM